MKIRRYNGTSWVQEYPEVDVDSIVATGTPSSSTFLRGDGAWATVEDSGNQFVNITGDTMTGSLTISGSNNSILMSDGHYINKKFDMLENASPQYILLCASAANNEVIGTIHIDRSSSNWQAALLEVVVTARSNDAVQGAALRTLQVLQSGERYEIVTLTYSGTQYIAVKYSGNVYPETVARFTGRMVSTGSAALLTTVGSSDVTGVNEFDGDTYSFLDVDTMHFRGNVGIGTDSPSSKLTIAQTGSGTNNSLIVKDAARQVLIGRDSVKAQDLNGNAATLYLNQPGGNTILSSSSGNVGIGTASPTQKLEVNGNINGNELHLNDTNSIVKEGNANSVRIQTNSGYVDIGPQNTGFSHFSTDRGRYYFNKGADFDGDIRAYSNNTTKIEESTGHIFELGNRVLTEAGGTLTGDLTLDGADLTLASGSYQHLARSSYITFYGDNSVNHSIASRNKTYGSDDDLRINTYGALLINLDSNNNNTSDASFEIGRHGGSGTISDWLFKVDGESGNVGIGTTSPSSPLTVAGTIESLPVSTTEGGDLRLRAATGKSYRYTIDNYSDNLRFIRQDESSGGNGQVRMFINSSGDVGIGTSSPAYKVDVDGDVNITGNFKVNGTNISTGGSGYTHPTHPGDDISIDTGALTGATVISDLDFNVTSDTEGHITDANATVSTRNLTASDIGAAASSHGHGNLTSAGGWSSSPATIGSGDYVIIGDSSDSAKLRQSSTQFGTSTTTFLRNDGTFATPPSGNTWTEIKTGVTTITSGTTATNVSLGSNTVDDTTVLAFELNTSTLTSYTSQIFIIKLEDSNSSSAGILFNALASNSSIQVGSIRVFRTLSMGPTSTSVSFSYSYKFTNGSSSETADTVYVGKIWKLGVTGS